MLAQEKMADIEKEELSQVCASSIQFWPYLIFRVLDL